MLLVRHIFCRAAALLKTSTEGFAVSASTRGLLIRNRILAPGIFCRKNLIYSASTVYLARASSVLNEVPCTIYRWRSGTEKRDTRGNDDGSDEQQI